MSRETWIVLGATSSIARAFARQIAEEGHSLVLAGRDAAELEALAADCRLRGAPSALPARIDMREPAGFGPVIDLATGGEGAVCAAVFTGSMPDQAAIDADPSLIEGVVTDSHTGPARFLTTLAPIMETRGGAVVGVGSVAGDRGRLGNYVYGSAKAGFHAYLSGLRNRLGRQGVPVLTVKPGFVDTAMTWGIEGMFLVADPADVAARIRTSLRKDRGVIYAPGFWWAIMSIIRAIPEPVFRKMKI
ncbi:MAG: SDR family NAD(P)-dependent oxidoreductase [Hasllibacter sp.]